MWQEECDVNICHVVKVTTNFLKVKWMLEINDKTDYKLYINTYGSNKVTVLPRLFPLLKLYLTKGVFL